MYTFPVFGYCPGSNANASVELIDKEDKMSQKTFWREVLVGLLCVSLATSISAQSGAGKPLVSYKGSDSAAAATGAAVGVAGVAAIITVVLTHKKKITGCANALHEGMTITDERDKQTYELLGSTTDFKAGDRVCLQVKRIKSKGNGNASVWQVEKLIRDYGSCSS